MTFRLPNSSYRVPGHIRCRLYIIYIEVHFAVFVVVVFVYCFSFIFTTTFDLTTSKFDSFTPGIRYIQRQMRWYSQNTMNCEVLFNVISIANAAHHMFACICYASTILCPLFRTSGSEAYKLYGLAPPHSIVHWVIATQQTTQATPQSTQTNSNTLFC